MYTVYTNFYHFNPLQKTCQNFNIFISKICKNMRTYVPICKYRANLKVIFCALTQRTYVWMTKKCSQAKIKPWNSLNYEILKCWKYCNYYVSSVFVRKHKKKCYFSMSNRTFKNCHILVNVEISTFLAVLVSIFRRFQSWKKWKKIKIFLYTILTLYTIFKNE